MNVLLAPSNAHASERGFKLSMRQDRKATLDTASNAGTGLPTGLRRGGCGAGLHAAGHAGSGGFQREPAVCSWSAPVTTQGTVHIKWWILTAELLSCCALLRSSCEYETQEAMSWAAGGLSDSGGCTGSCSSSYQPGWR